MSRFQILVVIQCIIFTTAAASNTVRVVRRIESQNPDRDAFSNPSCRPGDCPSNSNCRTSCCMCHCGYDHPNFLVKRWECLSNNDTEKAENSADTCDFSIRPENQPIEVLLTTEEASGKVKFPSSTARVNCNNDVIVDQWDYLNAHDQWVQGEGDAFSVSHRTVGGQDKNKKDLNFLEWNKKLDAKYSGLLIRVNLYCKASHRIGCLLAKLNGTYTYDTTTPPSPATSPTTSQTTTKAPNTPNINQPKSTLSTSPAKEETTTISNVNTGGQQAQESQKKKEQQSSTPGLLGGSIFGIVGGILAFLCLIIILAVMYRKRKTCISFMKKKKYQEPPVSNINTGNYEDPIYAEVPGQGSDFDNPVYVDPAAGNLNRRSKQDPLPVIPGSEGSYQPLNELTRTVQPEPTPPPLPAVSFPMGIDNEGHAYEGRLEIETEDYENPITNNNPGTEASDYDNPPQSATNNSLNEPSDYDNPSQTSPPETLHVNNSSNESSDYDNPPQAGNSSESADNQEEDGPQYFVLESEDTGM